MSTALAQRFEDAAAREPLAALAPSCRRELTGVLARTEAFEDLPGKWQAALLQSEQAPGAVPAHGGSCCGGHRSVAA
jgi:hypothetical protein